MWGERAKARAHPGHRAVDSSDSANVSLSQVDAHTHGLHASPAHRSRALAPRAQHWWPLLIAYYLGGEAIMSGLVVSVLGSSPERFLEFGHDAPPGADDTAPPA